MTDRDEKTVRDNVTKWALKLVFGESLRFIGFAMATLGVIWALANPAISAYIVKTLRNSSDFRELVGDAATKLRLTTHDDLIALQTTSREQDVAIIALRATQTQAAQNNEVTQHILADLNTKVEVLEQEGKGNSETLSQILLAVKSK